MWIRHLQVVLGAALLASGSASSMADQHSSQAETHEITIDQQVEIAQSMADHEMVAQSFDQEAAQFDKRAAEHERLVKYYRSGLGAGPNGSPARLANHCERIAKSLRQSAEDAREMARMHRYVAHRIVK